VAAMLVIDYRGKDGGGKSLEVSVIAWPGLE
jgi:hypothetical protein